jgi:glycerol-3-phosphate O-acyltransferase/dihydroxyacetone phosphate acyltransferase
MSDLDFTLAQLAFFGVIVLLAVDAIKYVKYSMRLPVFLCAKGERLTCLCLHVQCSPIKMFLHVFPSVSAWQVAAVAILLMIYVFISELKALLFFGVKVFFHSILSIFFREVQVVGRQNIPRYGPVIFTTNHANQFIDAVMVLATCERKVSYLIAEKSWNRPIVGNVAWAMDAVPVKRAQDAAVNGSGAISITLTKTNDETTKVQVNGTDTLFLSEIKVGDKIRPAGTAAQFKIISIESDTAMNIDVVSIGDETLPEGSVPFDILPHVDQKIVYEKVLDKLASGGAIGIFPEGGSHDRTDLLPLKVGIALIAYEALAKDGINIPIVPVGLNYYSRHRFRGGVVVEYGPPMYIETSTLQSYTAGRAEKWRVCNELLDR